MDENRLAHWTAEFRNGKSIFNRVIAAEELARIGTQEAVSALVEGLGDENPVIRDQVSICLQKVEEFQMVTHLAADLKSPDRDDRLKAIESLGNIGDESVIGALHGMAEDPDPAVRRAVAAALQKIGESHSVSLLMKGLSDDNKEVRTKSAESLGKIGNKRAFAALFMALKDQDKEVRDKAEASLKKLGLGGSTIADDSTDVGGDRPRSVVDNRDVREIVESQKLSDPDLQTSGPPSDKKWDVKQGVVKGMAHFGGDASESLIQALGDKDELLQNQISDLLKNIGHSSLRCLIEALKDANPLIRANAAYLLGTLQDPEALGPLTEVMKDADPGVRTKACEAAGVFREPKTIDFFEERLEDPEPAVRAKAAEALGAIQDRRSAGVLVLYLKDSSESVRVEIVRALGRLASKNAVTGLIGMMNDEDMKVRAASAEALGLTGDDGGIAVLVHALEDENPVAEKAQEALEKIGKKSVEALVSMCSHPDAQARARALETLGRIGDRRACPVLSNALQDSEALVRQKAVEALGGLQDIEIGSLEEVYRLGDDWMRKQAVEFLGKSGVRAAIEPLENAVRDPHPAVQTAAISSLGMLGKMAVPSLVRLYHNGTTVIRTAAVKALAQIKSKAAEETVLLALRDAEPEVRMHAASESGRMKWAKALRALINLLRDPDPFVRSAAAKSLGELGDPSSSNALLRLLGDVNPVVRAEAVSALGGVGYRGDFEPLIPLLKDHDLVVRSRTADVLGKIGNPKSVYGLIGVLNDKIEMVRKHAMSALKEIGPSAVEELCASAGVPYELIRGGIAETLGMIGDRRALKILSELLNDASEYVRLRAAGALGQLGAAAFTVLEAALKDPSLPVRTAVIDSLGKTGDPRVLSVLSACVNDPSETIRIKAVEVLGESALGQRGGKKTAVRKCLSCGRLMVPTRGEISHRWKYVLFFILGVILIPVLIGIPLAFYGAYRLIQNRAFFECRHCKRTVEIFWYEK
jgi:HEAT repeat protein